MTENEYYYSIPTGAWTSSTTTTWNLIDTTSAFSYGDTSFRFTLPTSTASVYSRKVEKLNPKIVFNYIKSKLNKNHEEKLKNELKKLSVLVKDAKELKQVALFEEYSKMIAILYLESKLLAVGIDTFVLEDHITKHMHKTSNLYFRNFDEFNKHIPRNVQTKINYLKKNKMFDEYWILHLDYTSEKLKSNEKKIIEKDPIIFGKLNLMPDRYYYIADWIDDYCDLTLSKFVKEVSVYNEKYFPEKIIEISIDKFKSYVTAVKDRIKRLKNTKSSNYKKLAKIAKKKELK